MFPNKTFIDDLLSVGGNLLGTALGSRHEAGAQMKERFDHLVHKFNGVSRSEFDTAFAMLAKARTLQDEILERLEAIEAKLGMSSGRRNNNKSTRRLPSVKNGNRKTKKR